MIRDKTIYEYRQQTMDYYLEEQIDEEEDNRKIFHTAVRKSDKERFAIHWSPYGGIDNESFRMIVELELFNCRAVKLYRDQSHSVNWDAELVREAYQRSPLFHKEGNNNVNKG